jgi:hypothetical protein
VPANCLRAESGSPLTGGVLHVLGGLGRRQNAEWPEKLGSATTHIWLGSRCALGTHRLPVFSIVVWLHFATGRDPWSMCVELTPPGLEDVGEGPSSVSHRLSVLPLGVKCQYGNPVEIRQFHDLGTPALVLALVSFAVSCLVTVLWVRGWLARYGAPRP